MQLNNIDWLAIIGFFILSLVIGISVSKKSGSSYKEFFLSGRNMPWWLLGISMVATTFSADTPNLVTDIVRNNGVSGNWVWWAFLLTGMLTVFVYARLWRRSGITTDLEFYELRYSGKEAAFLRGFRAFYLGCFFNVVIMASVCLAGIKICGVLLDWTPMQTVLITSIITLAYTALGGLKAVLITDFFQFILAMIGTVWAAVILVNLPQVGGLDALLVHENVIDKLNLLPDFSDKEALVTLLIIPLAVQWWNVWYPGAEPGGGGYIAQRMLSAKDENNAVTATLLFNAAHYALRPWPWILIALASLIVFPDLESLKVAFPSMDPNFVKDDMAYPAMLSYLPNGLLGLVIASLIAAFMSTISTHLNWGASYLVHDGYKRFIKKDAADKELIMAGRIFTVVLMIIAGFIALQLESALEAFNIILQIGAGTGLIFILRWFWWRINAYSEITAMIVSFLVAVYFQKIHVDVFEFGEIESHWQLIIGILITTFAWISVTFMTRPTDQNVLLGFYKLIRPHKAGWNKVITDGLANYTLKDEDISVGKLPKELLSMFLGTLAIYSALFSTGYIIYGETGNALIGIAVLAISLFGLYWNKSLAKL